MMGRRRLDQALAKMCDKFMRLFLWHGKGHRVYGGLVLLLVFSR